MHTSSSLYALSAAAATLHGRISRPGRQAGKQAASLSYDQAALPPPPRPLLPFVRIILARLDIRNGALPLQRPSGVSPRVHAHALSPLRARRRLAGRPSVRPSSVIANDHIHISAPTNGSAPARNAAHHIFIERQKFISSPAHNRRALQFGPRGREASIVLRFWIISDVVITYRRMKSAPGWTD